MQQNGIRGDQIMQVRGFADQNLRKKDAPLDPSNRRVSLIVQYQDKSDSDGPASGGSKEETKPAAAEPPKPPAKGQ
jgi:chemotaxis protein MotB